MFFKNERPIRDKRYLMWVATLPCCVCKRHGPSECHHLLRGTGQKGMGVKSGDNYCLPLCAECHRALHANGDETGFFQLHDIDPIEKADNLYKLNVAIRRK